MRETFRAYYRPSDTELAEIWANGIIVLDTNTLLNFFRYTPSTRDEFLQVLDRLKPALWIPHHVGVEFHKRRLTVIKTTTDAFGKITAALDSAQKDIESALNAYKHHPSISRTELMGEVSDFFIKLSETLEQQRREHADRISTKGDADATFSRITGLFDGKVGSPFSTEELDAICSEGETRYEKGVPPGFKDKDKTNENQFGDLIIWKEILRLGKERELPLIFVTDDTKDDWWWRSGGETQGPRVELVDEYWNHARQRIHFYEPLRFLEYARKHTDLAVSRESLDEVEEVSSGNSRAQRVLLERQRSLERSQAALIRRLERAPSSPHGSSEVRRLEIEDEELASDEETIARHLAMMRAKSNHSPFSFTDESTELSPDELHRLAEDSRKNIERAEFLLATTQQRRQDIAREIKRRTATSDRFRMQTIREFDRVRDELQEVSLALSELNE